MELQHHNNGNNNFPFSRYTTLWTVACSTIGGIYKAQASPRIILDVLSFNSSLAVMAYAFMSAMVGYCTKKGMDYFFEWLAKKKRK